MNPLLPLILLLTLTIPALANPTYGTGCGTPTQDPNCNDGGCATTFNSVNPVSSCQIIFATPETAGWKTQCWASDPDKVQLQMASDFNSFTISPVSPSTTLQGMTVYTVCTHYSQTGR